MFIAGVIRLRQHRTKEIPCKLPEIMKHLDRTCRPDYDEVQEMRNFSRGWLSPTEFSNITMERMGHVWKYTDSNVAGTLQYIGKSCCVYSMLPDHIIQVEQKKKEYKQ